MQHDLKTWPENFERIEQGHLTVTVRENDRPFASGDVINFQEFEPDSREVSHPGAHSRNRTGRLASAAPTVAHRRTRATSHAGGRAATGSTPAMVYPRAGYIRALVDRPS